MHIYDRRQTHNITLATEFTKDNPRGYKGVTVRTRKDGSKRYSAMIHPGGKAVWLGTHGYPEEAARAYDKAAIKHFGDFAWLNFPRSDYVDLDDHLRLLNR